MGAAALKGFPHDLTKCSTDQLQALIDAAILQHPIEYCDKDPLIACEQTISLMRSQGFRPITAQEYLEQLIAAKNGEGATIKLWIEDAFCTRSATDEDEFGSNIHTRRFRTTAASADATDNSVLQLDSLTSASSIEMNLPSTREQVEEQAYLISKDENNLLSQLDTEEWATPAAVHKQHHHV